MTVKKKALALAAVLALCLSAIGVTTAYFTDYESGKGGAVVELGGQTKIKEEMDENNKTPIRSHRYDRDADSVHTDDVRLRGRYGIG